VKDKIIESLPVKEVKQTLFKVAAVISTFFVSAFTILAGAVWCIQLYFQWQSFELAKANFKKECGYTEKMDRGIHEQLMDLLPGMKGE
jgi:hypothetical protein